MRKVVTCVGETLEIGFGGLSTIMVSLNVLNSHRDRAVMAFRDPPQDLKFFLEKYYRYRSASGEKRFNIGKL